jgi:hypothetical protein
MKQTIINEPPSKETPMKTKLASLFAVACALAISAAAHAQTSNPPSAGRPNILVIWGDDVGMYDISAHHRGLMGGSTPNIDRIAKAGMLFLDHYGQAPAPPDVRPSSPVSTPSAWAWPASACRGPNRA